MISCPAIRRGALAAIPALALLLGSACTEPGRQAPAASAPASTASAAATTASTAGAAGTVAASPTGTPAATSSRTTAASGATGATSVIVPPSAEGTRYSFACAEGKTFSILAYPAAQERVTLMVEGKTLELKQERQGSGTRHSDGNYTLIQKGVDAFIEQGGVQTYRDCKASRP